MPISDLPQPLDNQLNLKKQRQFQFSRVWIVIGLVFLSVVSIVLYNQFFAKANLQTSNLQSENISSNVENITPRPAPFSEMTIPSLRARSYESSLDDLTEVSSNSRYTSYLTNYDSDGLNINGQLTIPTGKEPESGWPAIVFIHGYIPPTQYQTLSNYSSYVDYLAGNGFVVFKIDLRGHADSEGDPGGAYYSEDYIVDVLHAYSALQNSEFVNPDAIGLWGHSMAGNVVMRSVAAKQNIPAVSIWAGAVYSYEDWQKYGIEDNSYRPPEMTSDRQKRREQ